MSYMRAGGLTTLIISMLTTVCLVWFSEWYGGFSSGEMVQRTFFWFAISLLGVTPVCLVLFPILHNIPALKYRPSGKVFAMLGGVLGAAIAGYALFRFRSILFPNTGISFVAIPLMEVCATFVGIVAGFLFERLARRTHVAPTLRVIEGGAADTDKTSA